MTLCLRKRDSKKAVTVQRSMTPDPNSISALIPLSQGSATPMINVRAAAWGEPLPAQTPGSIPPMAQSMLSGAQNAHYYQMGQSVQPQFVFPGNENVKEMGLVKHEGVNGSENGQRPDLTAAILQHLQSERAKTEKLREEIAQLQAGVRGETHPVKTVERDLTDKNCFWMFAIIVAIMLFSLAMMLVFTGAFSSFWNGLFSVPFNISSFFKQKITYENDHELCKKEVDTYRAMNARISLTAEGYMNETSDLKIKIQELKNTTSVYENQAYTKTMELATMGGWKNRSIVSDNQLNECRLELISQRMQCDNASKVLQKSHDEAHKAVRDDRQAAVNNYTNARQTIAVLQAEIVDLEIKLNRSETLNKKMMEDSMAKFKETFAPIAARVINDTFYDYVKSVGEQSAKICSNSDKSMGWVDYATVASTLMTAYNTDTTSMAKFVSAMSAVIRSGTNSDSQP